MKNTLLTAIAISIGLGMTTRKKAFKPKEFQINSDAMKTAIELAKKALNTRRRVYN